METFDILQPLFHGRFIGWPLFSGRLSPTAKKFSTSNDRKRGSVLSRFISSCMHYLWTQVLSKFKGMLWHMYILAFPTRWLMTKRPSVTVPVNFTHFTQAFASDNFYWANVCSYWAKLIEKVFFQCLLPITVKVLHWMWN